MSDQMRGGNMALHHRREIPDMRFEYDHAQNGKTRTLSGTEHRNSRVDSGRALLQRSSKSSSTGASRSKPHVHYAQDAEHHPSVRFFDDKPQQWSPPSSFISTVESSDEDEDPHHEPRYETPRSVTYSSRPTAIPASPSAFSSLFPSKRRLTIRHDDATLDGNMNLRVDTEVVIDGQRCDMTLFHLRMHDLKNREFSLRRYSRDSGREVCHSSVRQGKDLSEKHPRLQRSLSNAFGNIKTRSESRSMSASGLKRSDSGYGSQDSVDFDEDRRPRSAGQEPRNHHVSSTNVVQLEFSNYAHVQIKRVGNRSNRGYAFEYWGVHYLWRRRRDRDMNEVSFSLTKTGNDEALGFIRPVPLSSEELAVEHRLGGWIPPCSLWIEDGKIVHAQKDVSDVIVAAGLIALVDESIQMHFLHKGSKPSRMSRSRSGSFGVPESMRPRKFLAGLLHRRGSSFGQDHRFALTSQPSTNSKPSSSGTGAEQ